VRDSWVAMLERFHMAPAVTFRDPVSCKERRSKKVCLASKAHKALHIFPERQLQIHDKVLSWCLNTLSMHQYMRKDLY
jgi:hypothetical protein